MPLIGQTAGGKPQVLDHVAQFFVALGGQLGHLCALLHIGVIRVQRLQLQGFAAQLADQLGKTRALAQQAAVALVQLLALGIVQAQVERVAVGLGLTPGRHLVAQCFKCTHLAEARQAAHERQDARMERAHQLAGLHRLQVDLPQGEHLQQALDEVLARFAGEGDHGHCIQLVTQVMTQQQDTQHQRRGLACPGACHHAGRRGVTEDQLPLRGAGLGFGGQALGDIGLEALLQLGRQRQAPVVEQVVILAWHSGAVGARIADHQHLAPRFKALHPTTLEPFTHAIGMASALACGVAEEP